MHDLPEDIQSIVLTFGFPAIVEHHLAAGIGYKFTDTFSLDLGFVYAFENSISETGTNLSTYPVTIESAIKLNHYIPRSFVDNFSNASSAVL